MLVETVSNCLLLVNIYMLKLSTGKDFFAYIRHWYRLASDRSKTLEF